MQIKLFVSIPFGITSGFLPILKFEACNYARWHPAMLICPKFTNGVDGPLDKWSVDMRIHSESSLCWEKLLI